MRGKQGPPVDSCASASRTVSEHWLDPIPATERPFGNSTGGCDRGHCHILPALDDSAAMAAQAAEDGIEVVCATPHIRPDHLVSVAELPLRVDALRQELRRRGLDVEIALGGEVAQRQPQGSATANSATCPLVVVGGFWSSLILDHSAMTYQCSSRRWRLGACPRSSPTPSATPELTSRSACAS